VPATVLPNNLDTETKTSDCTPKEIYVEIIKMSSPQNITPYPSNFQGTPAYKPSFVINYQTVMAKLRA
jgi:hypothetical protein